MLKSTFRATSIAALASAGIVAAGVPALAADSARDFYKGKTVTIYVPFGPGGGYDTYARIMAPHFSKYLDANFIVQNKPGAGGIIGINTSYLGPKDGTNLVFYQGSSAAAIQSVGAKNARFDLLKMNHIATVAFSPWLLVVQPKSKANTIEDLKNFGRTITFGGSGISSAASSGGRMACMALRLDCKLIPGYKGSRASALALARGEVDAYYVSDSSAFRYVKAGNAKPIVVFGPTKSNFFPNVKTIFDVAKVDERGKWLIDFHKKLESLGRVLSGPPGIPEDRVALLRKMANDILTDPKFLEEAKAKRREIRYNDAEGTLAAIKGILNLDPEKKALAHEVITGEKPGK